MPAALPLVAAGASGFAGASAVSGIAAGGALDALGSGGIAALTAGAGLASAGAGYLGAGASKIPSINIPPPPGTAMIDQGAADAAAKQRASQRVAGGIDSTVSAGNQPGTQANYNQATSGQKTLLGS